MSEYHIICDDCGRAVVVTTADSEGIPCDCPGTTWKLTPWLAVRRVFRGDEVPKEVGGE